MNFLDREVAMLTSNPAGIMIKVRNKISLSDLLKGLRKAKMRKHIFKPSIKEMQPYCHLLFRSNLRKTSSAALRAAHCVLFSFS